MTHAHVIFLIFAENISAMKRMYNDATRQDEQGVNSRKGYNHERFNNSHEYLEMVQLANIYYGQMHDLHRKFIRDIDYYMGRQLNDTVVHNGMTITVHDYMEMKGMTPLSSDIITDKMVSMKGYMRNQYMSAKVKNVDAQEGDYALIISEFLRKNDNNNNMSEKYSEMFECHACLGFTCCKPVWTFRNGREDVFVNIVDPFMLSLPPFSTQDLDDVEFIAEAHDLTWPQLLTKFYRKAGDEQKLTAIYTAVARQLPLQGYNDTGTNQTDRILDFLHPTVVGKYRVIEVWRKEYNRALWCHDRLNASVGFRPLADKKAIDAENSQRRLDNIRRDEYGQPLLDDAGNMLYYVPESELELIEYEYRIEEMWYYRFLSPNGYLLEEGVSPYKVQRDGYSFYFHPYVFLAYGMRGEIRSFEDRIIDKQRQYNHDNILLDFIIMNSSKGALAVDEEAMSDLMSLDEIAENYVKVDGTIVYTTKKGGNVPQQLQNRSLPAGIDMILQRDKDLVQQQSNVQSALQGAAPTAGTSARRYMAEQQASATGIADYVMSFNNFKLRVAKKQVWMIQAFYDSHRSVQITGEDVWKYFDSETMGDIECDLTLTLDMNSAVIREDMKELAYQAYEKDEIAFVQMLDAADFGDTARLKRMAQEHHEEKMRLAQQQAAAGAVPTGATPGAVSRENGADKLTGGDNNNLMPTVGTSGTSA